jgi:hypothetical protein
MVRGDVLPLRLVRPVGVELGLAGVDLLAMLQWAVVMLQMSAGADGSARSVQMSAGRTGLRMGDAGLAQACPDVCGCRWERAECPDVCGAAALEREWAGSVQMSAGAGAGARVGGKRPDVCGRRRSAIGSGGRAAAMPVGGKARAYRARFASCRMPRRTGPLSKTC